MWRPRVSRFLDVAVAATVLIALAPVMGLLAMVVRLLDGPGVVYAAERVGRHGRPFTMLKLRTMVHGADQIGGPSTAGDDLRLTRAGRVLRRFKLDELPQLWNVLTGQMALVGPRPNVPAEVALYTDEERQLLSVRPGITDIASLVFADEGDILAGSPDPDLRYHQLIRPWKNRLGLFYVEHRSPALDLRILWLTVAGQVSRGWALRHASDLLRRRGAPDELVSVARRASSLAPCSPPGSPSIVTKDDIVTLSAGG